MNESKVNFFDEAASLWDTEPKRVELSKSVGTTILNQARPTRDMDVLDYGCGTGLLGLFLLPHVHSVTGVDSSAGMLQVLEDKIQAGGIQQMRTEKLDLQHDPIPAAQYHLIASNMVMHHVEKIEVLVRAFHQMLSPGGILALADLDTEPGLFHGPDTSGSVFHLGFDRDEFMALLGRNGFTDLQAVTAHVVHKPIASGEIREFPVFLITGHRG